LFGDTEDRIDYVRIELLSPTARDLGHGSLDGATYACWVAQVRRAGLPAQAW
jgi:hypothetical protein